MPKVSIIVPVYNVESKLRRCLDSIKHQDYSDFECILVDDGSSDISGNICDEYAHSDRRFKVLHQKNHGVSAARNAGLKVALGDWILFVDSDDWVSSQFISAFFNGSMADIVFQGLMKDSLQGSNPVLFEHNPTHVFVENLYYLEKKDLLGWCYNKMFRSSIIKENNICYPENISLREDAVFTLQVLCHANSITWRNVAYYHYVETVGSLMTKLRPYEELAICNDILYNLRCEVVRLHPYNEYAIWAKNEFFKYKATIVRYAFYRKYYLSRTIRYCLLKEITHMVLDIQGLGTTDQLIFKICRMPLPLYLKDTIINIIAKCHGHKYYKGQI